MESLFRYWCNEVGYAELAIQKKWLFSKKYLLLKKLLFWKSSCAEKPPPSEKYMFRVITNS